MTKLPLPRTAWREQLRELGQVRSWADLRDAAVVHRRALAAAAAALAVATAIPALRSAPPALPTMVVVAAARDLPSGTILAANDLAPLTLPRSAVPTGALTSAGQAEGQLLAGAVTAHEPLTTARVLGATTLPTGEVAVPVHLPDPAAAALLAAGDRIDILAAPPQPGGPASDLATDVLVLATPDPGSGLLLVAATPNQALALGGVAPDRLSYLLRSPA
ncbi:MAG: SAF domain-containing protein [Mycobacteriales bacterium]